MVWKKTFNANVLVIKKEIIQGGLSHAVDAKSYF